MNAQTDKILYMVDRVLWHWHEDTRAEWVKRWAGLDYDSPYYVKTKEVRQRWISLNKGDAEKGPASGYAVVDKQTGDVYRSGAYGVPNKKKRLGNVLTDEPADIAAKLPNI